MPSRLGQHLNFAPAQADQPLVDQCSGGEFDRRSQLEVAGPRGPGDGRTAGPRTEGVLRGWGWFWGKNPYFFLGYWIYIYIHIYVMVCIYFIFLIYDDLCGIRWRYLKLTPNLRIL